MVGFHNVGKSSVINVLMGNASNDHNVVRVAVAAQPGKTKHFQTLLIPSRDDMLLCDCPGLVFPSFVNNTADLIAAGVYAIAQMRDPWPVVNLLCKRIPRIVLNAHYGIEIPLPTADAMLKARKGELPPPTAEEFLTTFCVARSLFAASSGIPDHAQASKVVIRDYANGRLLYNHAPPTVDDIRAFQKDTLATTLRNTKKLRDTLLPDDDNVEDDDMLQTLMGTSHLPSSKPANDVATRKKKWGKKCRKFSNRDPYGCHSTPDETLGGEGEGASGKVKGLSVKAGKYGKKGFTRANGYGGSRSATVAPDKPAVRGSK
jgi:large subunit GTPase 1